MAPSLKRKKKHFLYFQMHTWKAAIKYICVWNNQYILGFIRFIRHILKSLFPGRASENTLLEHLGGARARAKER